MVVGNSILTAWERPGLSYIVSERPAAGAAIKVLILLISLTTARTHAAQESAASPVNSCPNCHRRVHYGEDAGYSIDRSLLVWQKLS